MMSQKKERERKFMEVSMKHEAPSKTSQSCSNNDDDSTSWKLRKTYQVCGYGNVIMKTKVD